MHPGRGSNLIRWLAKDSAPSEEEKGANIIPDFSKTDEGKKTTGAGQRSSGISLFKLKRDPLGTRKERG